jgi:hypothetical protein
MAIVSEASSSKAGETEDVEDGEGWIHADDEGWPHLEGVFRHAEDKSPHVEGSFPHDLSAVEGVEWFSYMEKVTTYLRTHHPLTIHPTTTMLKEDHPKKMRRSLLN